ncbi:MAG: hypothetical protein HY705_02915 [Gemmatimonadetes bacterium]|nr:hypothetical protein [Gemmatimonadota bacterium]
MRAGGARRRLVRRLDFFEKEDAVIRPAGPAVGALLLLHTGAALAQGVRVSGSTSAQYFEVRPLVTDSVAVETTDGAGVLRRAGNGVPVRCFPGESFCRYYRAVDPVSTLPLIQDVRVSAWGFVPGLRLYAHVRGRAALGDARDLWPRADDRFDALALFLELDRGFLRARAGRQWKSSGLGLYNFDGGLVRLQSAGGLGLELFGGWGLVRGLNEPVTAGALRAIEELAPDERTYLVGAEARVGPWRSFQASVLYQREIRRDRAALHSERVAADASLRVAGSLVAGDLELDLAGGAVNEARLRADLPSTAAWGAGVEVRRYQPYFDLWTIWGAFAPVGYSEALGRVHWDAGSELDLRARGGWRRYDESGAGLSFAPLRRDGWRLGADGAWRFAAAWTLQAGYQVDVGFGAARADGDLGLRRELGERASLAARLSAFQTAQEFRIGEGTVLGLALEGGVRARAGTRLAGSLQAYHHRSSVAAGPDWTQLRASLRVEWALGAEPGQRAAGGGR